MVASLFCRRTASSGAFLLGVTVSTLFPIFTRVCIFYIAGYFNFLLQTTGTRTDCKASGNRDFNSCLDVWDGWYIPISTYAASICSWWKWNTYAKKVEWTSRRNVISNPVRHLVRVLDATRRGKDQTCKCGDVPTGLQNLYICAACFGWSIQQSR